MLRIGCNWVTAMNGMVARGGGEIVPVHKVARGLPRPGPSANFRVTTENETNHTFQDPLDCLASIVFVLAATAASFICHSGLTRYDSTRRSRPFCF